MSEARKAARDNIIEKAHYEFIHGQAFKFVVARAIDAANAERDEKWRKAILEREAKIADFKQQRNDLLSQIDDFHCQIASALNWSSEGKDFVAHVREIVKENADLKAEALFLVERLKVSNGHLIVALAKVEECRGMLQNALDRDKDPKDRLRDLVCVAINSLHWKNIEVERLEGLLREIYTTIPHDTGNAYIIMILEAIKKSAPNALAQKKEEDNDE